MAGDVVGAPTSTRLKKALIPLMVVSYRGPKFRGIVTFGNVTIQMMEGRHHAHRACQGTVPVRHRPNSEGSQMKIVAGSRPDCRLRQ